MLGAIIGDIIGSRWEFNPTNKYDFALFSEENSYTDDTICTVAVADAILTGKDYGSSIHEWCRRYPYPMGGYGGNFAKWVRSSDPKPYGSYGNGAAMKVSPIGMFFENPDDVLCHAEMSAACTHNHPIGLNSAKAIAYATWMAVKSGDGLLHRRILEERVKEICEVCTSRFDIDFPVNLDDFRNRFDETCQGTLPAAFAILYKSRSFEEAIRYAVSLGGDADTLAAIVGSVAEHIWGIPEWIKEAALKHLPQEMRDVIERFYDECWKHESYKPETRKLKDQETLMLWKLGLGNMNRTMIGQNPNPDKSRPAARDSWKTRPMPGDSVSEFDFRLRISDKDMSVIRMGHIPECQEDHWFMYCDEEYIRYYRSWSGSCAFEAHYIHRGNCCMVDHLTVNRNLVEFGVNGDAPAEALFIYLIVSEISGHSSEAWAEYIRKWEGTEFARNQV